MLQSLFDLLMTNHNAANAFGALASALAAFFALIVSTISIVISVWAVRSDRQHNTLSVRPLAEVSVVDCEDCLRVKLVNLGTGPMLITALTVSDGSTTFPSLIDWMPPLLGQRAWNFFVGNIAGRAIAPCSEIILIELIEDDDDDDFAACRDTVRSALARLTIEVEYTDVFNTVIPKHSKSLAWFGRRVVSDWKPPAAPASGQVERRGGIDPAALAAASLASAVSTFAQSGPYTLLSSVLGVSILMLVRSYDIDPHRNWFQSVAYSCVSGLTTLLAVGYLLELLFAWSAPHVGTSEVPQWVHFLLWVFFSLGYLWHDKRARR